MLTYIFNYSSLLILCTILIAQPEPDSRNLGYGDITASILNSEWGVFNNPASIHTTGNIKSGIFYSPAPFGLSELAKGAVVMIKNLSSFNAGLGADYFGFDLYKQITMRLTIEKDLFSEVYVGGRINYSHLSIKNYGSKGLITFDVGVIAGIIDSVNLGSYITNISGERRTSDDEISPIKIKTGISYNGIKNFVLLAEIENELNKEINLKCGFEYFLMNTIYLRSGFNSLENSFSCGTGLRFNLFTFDFSAVFHNELGMTNSFSLGVEF